jgi:CDP-glucose 4,6-dehydratase
LLQRDYVYIEDAVAAYLAIGERLSNPAVTGKLFRIATGSGISVLDMVKRIARAAGLPELKPRVLNEESEERIDTFYKPEMEQTVLEWKSLRTLDEGLSRSCQWYRDFLNEQMKTK